MHWSGSVRAPGRLALRVLGALVGTYVMASCSDAGVSGPSLDDRPRGVLRVEPAEFSLSEGDSVRLAADFEGSGRFNADYVVWTVRDAAIGTIRDHWFVATGQGNTRVDARYMGLDASGEGHVFLRPVKVELEGPDAPMGFAGRQLADGTVVRVTGRDGLPVVGAPVTFQVVEGGGSVSEEERVTDAKGRAGIDWTLGPVAGANVLTASVKGLDPVRIAAEGLPDPSTATVTILRGDDQTAMVGTTLPDSLVVRLVDANGNALPGVPLEWSFSSGTAVGFEGSVVETTSGPDGRAALAWRLGTVAGLQEALVAPTGATSTEGPAAASKGNGGGGGSNGYGKGGKFDAGAEPGPAASIEVDPSSATLKKGSGFRLSAVLRDEFGNPTSGKINWSSSDESVATVDGGGLVAGVEDGQATVEARVKNLTDAASITVSTPQPASIGVASGNAQEGSAGAKLAAPLVVVVKDAGGSVTPGVTVSWAVTSGGGSVASGTTVTDANGRAQVLWTLGGELGTQGARASVEGVGSVAFSASAGPGAVSTLAVDPASVKLGVGVKQTLHATAKDAYGNVVTKAPSWSADDPAVVGLSGDGEVTGMASGSTTVRAKLDGVEADVAVDVDGSGTAPAVAQVTVDPASFTFTAPGQTLQLSVVATDSSGAPVDGVTYTFESTDAGVVSVDSSGKLTAVSVGVAAVVVGVATYAVTDTVGVEVAQQAPIEGVAFADSFESGDLSTSQNGFSWGGGVNAAINADAAYAHSGSHSLRLTHPAKPAGEDNVTQEDFQLPDVREVWVEYWMRVPEGYFHRDDEGPDNNKFFQLWDLDRSNEDVALFVELEEDNGNGKSRLKAGVDNDWMSSRKYMDPEDGFTIFLSSEDGGNWIRVRVHAKIGTPGATDPGLWDGVVEIWKNNTLLFNRYDLPMLPSTSGHDFFRHGRLWGWQNSGYDVETVFYVDDVIFYISDPGW